MTGIIVDKAPKKRDNGRAATWMMTMVLSVLTFIIASCSDDLGALVTPDEVLENNVTLFVPSVKGVAATRADELDEEDDEAMAEGSISELLMLAYPTEGGSAKCIKLSGPSALTAEYATYKFTLKPGDYRIYLVANLSPYTGQQPDATTSEDELRAMILDYSADKMPNLEDGLPMAACPTDIQEHSGGIVTIPEYKSATITADLKFLCSKVRVTLFFDSEHEDSFSRAGFGTLRPLFSDATLENVADATFLDSTLEPEHGYRSGCTTLQRKEYPEGVETADDVKAYSGTGTMKTSSESASATRMAWQTTMYLPENLHTEVNKATVMSMDAIIEGNGRRITYRIHLPELVTDGDDTKVSPLKRAVFHDITACVTSISKEFEMNVRVAEWTVKTLAHAVHGPYHLSVEKTENVPVTAGEETHLWYKSDVPVSFESQKEKIDGTEIDVLIIEKMEGHENDSIVITANPALPLDYDLNESYFHIIAGNLKKKIQIWPFTIKPFLKVTPEFTEVEVREMIESGSDTHSVPLRFTTNLSKVGVRLGEGFDQPEAPVAFKVLSTCNSPGEGEYVYTGDNAHDGMVRVDMNGFVSGNNYWTDNHIFKIEFTAFDKEGEIFGEPITAEIHVIPKRYTYRIYFRPAADDWANPHVYIYESLALPYTLDKTKVKDSYKDRAGKPVGGFVFKNLGEGSEAGLQYSYTGKISFRGWNTQGGPACNDPYEAAMFNPLDAEGFYVFGQITPTTGSQTGKTGYGLKYIPPSNRNHWLVSGADEATIRERYDIDTDYMQSHRSKLTHLCPLCQGNDTYNIKFPGIRMLMSEKYPGWWYIDLTEVANPGKTLIMFHDGHASAGSYQVPGAHKPGIPLFDFPDNEGWVLYTGGNVGEFVDNQPSVHSMYNEDVYRIYFPKQDIDGITVELRNASDNGMQSDVIEALSPAVYYPYNSDFNYVEFRLSSRLSSRNVDIDLISKSGGKFEGKVSLTEFEPDDNWVRNYTFAQNTGHGGLPDGTEIDSTKYRLYWLQSAGVIGFNLWFGTWAVNNYNNNGTFNSTPYITGSEVLRGGEMYDYYEFQIQNQYYASSGWGLHFGTGSNQTYAYNRSPLQLNDFGSGPHPNIKSVYRDDYFNVIPYGPEAQGNNYRIYWRRYNAKDGVTYDLNVAWFWTPNMEHWITTDPDEIAKGTDSNSKPILSITGSATINGIEYYYYDFTETSNMRPPLSCGIIIRTKVGWVTDAGAPTNKNCDFEKNSFYYDSSIGRNVAFVNPSFNGIGL